MKVKQIYRVKSLQELSQRVIEIPGVKFFLAGGTDLIVKSTQGLIPESSWIDITGLEELQKIEARESEIFIGALVTHTQIEQSPLLQHYAPALVQGAASVGSQQIRNRGTIGGNLANASPAADTVPPLYALSAKVLVLGPSGEREVPIETFFVGPGKTVLVGGELILGVVIPKYAGIKGAYLKLGQRKALAIAKVSVAVSCLMQDAALQWVKIALGAVAPTVVRAVKVEAYLAGKQLNTEVIAQAEALALQEACPISDIRSSKDYRCRMQSVLLRRALKRLASG
jgi:xanthine dehydrogenase FAD-binding subunit